MMTFRVRLHVRPISLLDKLLQIGSDSGLGVLDCSLDALVHLVQRNIIVYFLDSHLLRDLKDTF